MNYQEVKSRIGDPDWTIIDVMPSKVYHKGHLPTARSLPFDDIDRGAHEVLPDLSHETLVYCRNRH